MPWRCSLCRQSWHRLLRESSTWMQQPIHHQRFFMICINTFSLHSQVKHIWTYVMMHFHTYEYKHLDMSMVDSGTIHRRRRCVTDGPMCLRHRPYVQGRRLVGTGIKSLWRRSGSKASWSCATQYKQVCNQSFKYTCFLPTVYFPYSWRLKFSFYIRCFHMLTVQKAKTKELI